MQRKNREISIFNMSALDLFASALGAFLVLTVVALPYYLKVDSDLIAQLKQCNGQLQSTQQQLQSTQQQLQQCQTQNQQLQAEHEQLQTKNQQCNGQLRQCQEQNQQLQAENEQLQRDLAKTFLSVVILWPDKDDIDLHITDPNNNEFYYKKHNRTRGHFPNSSAQLSWDVVVGPGAEVWDSASPEPGIYKVEYLLFSKRVSAVTVKGKLYYRDGFIDLPAKTLSRLGQRVTAIKIKLGADGRVTLL